jgi:hypothetical protein
MSELKNRSHGWMNPENVVAALMPNWSNRAASSASSCGDGQVYALAVTRKAKLLGSARFRDI